MAIPAVNYRLEEKENTMRLSMKDSLKWLCIIAGTVGVRAHEGMPRCILMASCCLGAGAWSAACVAGGCH